MSRANRLLVRSLIVGLVLSGIGLVGGSAALGSSEPKAASSCRAKPCGPIKHIVIIVKENHSFDNLFGLYKHADGASTARIGNKVVKMPRTPDSMLGDLLGTSVAPVPRSTAARWIVRTDSRRSAERA